MSLIKKYIQFSTILKSAGGLYKYMFRPHPWISDLTGLLFHTSQLQTTNLKKINKLVDSALPNHYQPCLWVANSKHMLRKEIWKLYQIKWFFYFIILKHVHRIIITADRCTNSWEHDRFIGDDLTLPLSPSAPLHRAH